MDQIAGDSAGKIFSFAHQFENKARFSSWAYSVIRNTITDTKRGFFVNKTHSLEEQLETLNEMLSSGSGEGAGNGGEGDGELPYEHSASIIAT